MATAKQIINSTRAHKDIFKAETPRGEVGFDNARDDIEKIKNLREGTIEKVPVNNNDIANKKYVDDVVAAIPPAYSDEKAQDAVGAMIGPSLQYVDATPLLDAIQNIRTTSTTVTFKALTLGVSDAGYGRLDIHGDVDGTSGILNLYNGAIQDDVVDYWQLRGYTSGGDFRISRGAAQGGDFRITTAGNCIAANALTIGIGTADIDYTLTFDGQTNDGVMTWMEDEDYFKFSDDILLMDSENIYFRDTALSISSADDGHLDIAADTSIDLNTPLVNCTTIIATGKNQGEFYSDDGTVGVTQDDIALRAAAGTIIKLGFKNGILVSYVTIP